jgi:hypothetical protein
MQRPGGDERMTELTGNITNFSEDEMRRIAERLESANPLWMVVFGAYTHEFVAFPRFDTPRGGVIITRYPDALPDRMREVEKSRLLDRVRRGLLVT